MPGEVKDVQQDEANADQVAPSQDIDLDSAALEAERRLAGEVPDATPAEEPKEEPAATPVEEVKEPVAEPKEGDGEQPPASPGDTQEGDQDLTHGEKSWVGRKLKAQKEEFARMLDERFGQLIERLPVVQQTPLQSVPPAPELEPEYIDLSSPEGLDKFLSQREQQRAQAAQQDKVQYSVGYQSQVGDWQKKATASDDPDVTEIHKLLVGDTPFNVRRSSDPKVDFEVNLSKAEAHFYKQKAKTPTPERKSPLQNATPRAPLAVGGEGRADAPGGTPKPLRISPAAMEFAKAQGWSDEEVSKVLSAPLPNSFVKGRR